MGGGGLNQSIKSLTEKVKEKSTLSIPGGPGEGPERASMCLHFRFSGMNFCIFPLSGAFYPVEKNKIVKTPLGSSSVSSPGAAHRSHLLDSR